MYIKLFKLNFTMFEFGIKGFTIDTILEHIYVTIVFVIYVAVRVYKFIKKKLKKTNISNELNSLSVIYEKLIELRLLFGASRVTITQFHNGEYYVNDTSILKMSITHETDEDGTARVIDKYQSININKYNKFLIALDKNDVVSYNNVSSIESHYDDDMLLDLKLYGTESFYSVKLHNTKGQIFGFISLSFNENKEIDITEFKEYANMIGFLLRKK
jgi:hypothetical protein